jgi:putative transposase
VCGLASRKVHVAGVTPHPDERWMVQIARNVTMEQWGLLAPGQYLIHDRDGKYGPAFQQIIDAAGGQADATAAAVAKS